MHEVSRRRASDKPPFIKTKHDREEADKEIRLIRFARSITPPYHRSEPVVKWKKATAMAGSLGCGLSCLENVDPKSIRAGSTDTCDSDVKQLLELMCA